MPNITSLKISLGIAIAPLNLQTVSRLAKIESQVRRITDDEVAILAEALGVKIGKLYEGGSNWSTINQW